MMNETKRVLSLYRDNYHYSICYDKPYKRLCFFAVAETEVENIIAIKVWTFGLRWPWLRHVECFTNIKEGS